MVVASQRVAQVDDRDHVERVGLTKKQGVHVTS